jgi:hypothetical protein
MVGMINPLVKGSGDAAVRALGLFGLGALLGSSLIGASLGAAGVLIRPVMGPRPSLLVIAGIAAALAIADFRIAGLRTPGLGRQTCSWWWKTKGPTMAWFAWGVDLGLAIASVRVTSIYWLVVAMVMVLIPFAAAPLVLAGYAAGLTLGIAAAAVMSRMWNLEDGGARALMRSRHFVGAVSGVLLTVFAGIFVGMNR